MAINANAEVTVTDSVIDWLDTTPISDSDIDAKVTELQAAEDAKETAKTNAKVSGNTKAIRLRINTSRSYSTNWLHTRVILKG